MICINDVSKSLGLIKFVGFSEFSESFKNVHVSLRGKGSIPWYFQAVKASIYMFFIILLIYNIIF